jgi:hypothetical protein
MVSNTPREQSSQFDLPYTNPITHRVEMMTMNVKTNSDTRAHPELGTVGDFVVVLEVNIVIKGSTGLGVTLVDDVVVVATVVSSTDIGSGVEVTEGQQCDSTSRYASTPLNNPHPSEPVSSSFASSMSSAHVAASPILANGT